MFPHRKLTLLLSLLAALALGGCSDDTKATADDAGSAGSDAGQPSLDASEPSIDAGEPGPDGGSTDAGSSEGPDAGADPCVPNPCDDAAGHRSRCLWDGSGGFECHCDVGFHESEGLCCPAFSSSQQGACVCNAGFELVAGECVVRCSEESIEGLSGWCPAGQVCVQGACFEDRCEGFACAASSTCVMRAGEPFCLCDQGLHLSGALCCPLNASEADGHCACDPGFVIQDGACVPDPSNHCFPTNPCGSAELHRNTCIQDGSAQGYHCACNQGYREQDGACVLATWASCPTGLTCRADVCVPPDLSQEQCLTDADCHTFFPEAPTTCNASAAGGICLGCTEASDCPGNSQCTSFGTCALLCSDDSDCPYGRCYASEGYCGQARCSADADCANGTVCVDDDGNGQGLCLRVPCVETACSPTNPNGTCAGAGEACIYGSCVSSCAPNPCDEELNKTVCSTASGAPACLCDAGYSAAADGRCLPEASQCTAGFACENGRCADPGAQGFVCAQDADCGAGLTCSPSLPSGSCQGCGGTVSCPAGLDCLAGYCLAPCSTNADCHEEMSCRGSGYCGRKECSSSADCDAPYVCVPGGDGSGTCQRAVCEAP